MCVKKSSEERNTASSMNFLGCHLQSHHRHKQTCLPSPAHCRLPIYLDPVSPRKNYAWEKRKLERFAIITWPLTLDPAQCAQAMKNWKISNANARNFHLTNIMTKLKSKRPLSIDANGGYEKELNKRIKEFLGTHRNKSIWMGLRSLNQGL